MQADFAKALDMILGYEGGYVLDPQDPGGATNLGVTQATLASYRGRPVSIAEVKALRPADVSPIYEQRFWLTVDGDKLPAGVDLITFDAAVQHGPVRAAKFLQQAVGVAVDGHLGPVTIAAAHQDNALATIQGIRVERASFYHSLGTFDRFGKGWMNRLARVATTATEWAAA